MMALRPGMLVLTEEQFKPYKEALEKQIPKKPIIINYNGRAIPYCPMCKALLVKFADDDYREIFGEDWVHMNYCDVCGWKIDWSDCDEEGEVDGQND